MNHDIFISYSSKQKSIADGVCHYLEENGFKCWMAPRDIPVGSDYGDLIEEAIKTSRVVVLAFSEAASISKWVKGEINVAFTEDKPILPFRVDETEIKGGFRVMLNQMHWIDAFPHYADRLPDLLSSICGLLGRQARKNVAGSATKSSDLVSEKSNIINGHEYVDLGLPSGTLWATCNIGANKPEDYGDYFAWGETRPKSVYYWSTLKYYSDDAFTKYTGKDCLKVLQPEDDAAMTNWGLGWRMPTKEEWKELVNCTNSIWTTINGINGRLFTASNDNHLFLPAAGARAFELLMQGREGLYWSSSLYTDASHAAWEFVFQLDRYDKFGIIGQSRFTGASVRAVRKN